MSEHKMVTEREARKRERGAFVKGREHCKAYPMGNSDAAARSFYPLPNVTRVRVVDDGAGIEWKIEGDEILYRRTEAGSPWRVSLWINVNITMHRVRLWADLLANPTEEVEPDADA